MDVNTAAPILAIIMLIFALGLFTLAIAGIMDWYGMINVSWLNPERRDRRQDTQSRRD